MEDDIINTNRTFGIHSTRAVNTRIQDWRRERSKSRTEVKTLNIRVAWLAHRLSLAKHSDEIVTLPVHLAIVDTELNGPTLLNYAMAIGLWELMDYLIAPLNLAVADWYYHKGLVVVSPLRYEGQATLTPRYKYTGTCRPLML